MNTARLPERPAAGWDVLDLDDSTSRHFRRPGFTDHPYDDMRVHETDDGWLIGIPGSNAPIVGSGQVSPAAP